MSLKIKPLPPEVRKNFTDKVIGQVTCPECSQDNVQVNNNEGQNGNIIFSYLENHYKTRESSELCVGSGKMIYYFD